MGRRARVLFIANGMLLVCLWGSYMTLYIASCLDHGLSGCAYIDLADLFAVHGLCVICKYFRCI